VATGDVNRDHRDEVVTAHVLGNATTLRVLFVDPTVTANTTSTPGIQVPLALSTAAGVSVADFNRDGRPDIAVAGTDARPVASPRHRWRARRCQRDLHNAATTVPPVSYFMAGRVPVAQAVADLDHDGRPDVLCANSVGVTSLLNSSHASFERVQRNVGRKRRACHDAELARRRAFRRVPTDRSDCWQPHVFGLEFALHSTREPSLIAITAIRPASRRDHSQRAAAPGEYA
jgi:hypothetical protein